MVHALVALLIFIHLCSSFVLSAPRSDLAAASLSTPSTNWVLFAGGCLAGEPSDIVDVFTLSVASSRDLNLDRYPLFSSSLSQPRYGLAGASAGSVAAFAGGLSASGPSAVVDLFDMKTKTWRTASLSAASGSVFGVGVSSIIVFGQFVRAQNETLVDMLDIQTGNWSAYWLPDECYRAGSRADNITLLCNSGVSILATTSRTWSSVKFVQPLTRDSLAGVTIGTEWLRHERDALSYASMQLLSPPDARSCGMITASGSDWVSFIGIDSTLHGSIQMYRGNSIAELAFSGSVLLANPRVGTAVAYEGLNDTLVIAGGVVLADRTQCNSPRLPAANIDLYPQRGAIRAALSPACKEWPTNLEKIFCGDAGSWAVASPLVVPSRVTLTIHYTLTCNDVLTLAPDSVLQITPKGSVATRAGVQFGSDSTLRIVRSVWHAGTSLAAFSTAAARVEFGTNVSVVVYRTREANEVTLPWQAIGTSFENSNLVNVRLQGFWPSEPGEVSWTLLAAFGGSSIKSRTNFAFSLSEIEWTESLKAVSRWACPTEIEFSTEYGGDPYAFSITASSETDTSCGIGMDVLYIVLMGASLAALVVLGIRRQLRPQPYTLLAPVLEKEETCSICLQSCEAPVLIRCKHRFCAECIEQWASLRNTCPNCRKEMRARPDLTAEAQGLHFTSALSYGFVTVVALCWLDATRRYEVTFEGYMLIFFAIVALFCFVAAFISHLYVFCAARDRDVPHPWGVRYYALNWHTYVPLFAFALLLLSYSALQRLYAGYYAEVFIADTTGSTLLAGFVANHTLTHWSNFTHVQRNGLNVSLDIGDWVQAMHYIGVSMHISVYVSIFLLVASLVNWCLVVSGMSLEPLLLLRRVSRAILPCVAGAVFVEFLALCFAARDTLHYSGGNTYADVYTSWMQYGSTMVYIAVLASGILLVLLLHVLVRMHFHELGAGAGEAGVEMQMLSPGAGDNDENELHELARPAATVFEEESTPAAVPDGDSV